MKENGRKITKVVKVILYIIQKESFITAMLIDMTESGKMIRSMEKVMINLN